MRIVTPAVKPAEGKQDFILARGSGDTGPESVHILERPFDNHGD